MRFLSVLVAAGMAGLVLASPLEKRVSKFQFFGVNEAGAEFGNTNLPGTKGKDYTWPTLSTLDSFINKGMNAFRICLMMERLTQKGMTGALDSTYLGDLKTTVKYITDKKKYAIIDPHNYGRYNGAIIQDAAGFQTWWQKVAAEFKDNEYVIFDTNNEYHDMDQDLVVKLNQAAIDGIRAAGATKQYIFVEGNSWTGAWTWTSSQNSATMGQLKDKAGIEGKIIFEMHQYLDSDGSGTHTECVSSTIGRERITAATQWLKQNNFKGVIGEFAGGNNDQCKNAVKDMLSYMNQNSDVWVGALWWAAGPWWADYMYSMEPSSGVAYNAYLSLITQYA